MLSRFWKKSAVLFLALIVSLSIVNPAVAWAANEQLQLEAIEEASEPSAEGAVQEATEPSATEAVDDSDQLSSDESDGITIQAAQSEDSVGDTEGLKELLIYTGNSVADMQATAYFGTPNAAYPDRTAFHQKVTQYDLNAMDARLNETTRIAVVPAEAGSRVRVLFGQELSQSKAMGINTSLDEHIAGNWVRGFTAPGKNTFTIEVIPPNGSSNQTVVYTINVYLSPTLSGLSFKDGEQGIYLDQAFDALNYTYGSTVSNSTDTLEVLAVPKLNSYTISYNGFSENNVPISDVEQIEIELSVGEGADRRSTVYTVALNKVAAYSVQFAPSPADATVVLYDPKGARVEPNAPNSYASLLPGVDYTYVSTKYGYIAQKGIISGPASLNEGIYNIHLVPAPEPAIPLPDYTGEWTNFRGNSENMGVTEAPTPTIAQTTYEKWAVRIGTGYAVSPTPPIIVNNYLYVAVTNKVYKLDKETGGIVATSDPMAGNVGYALNPITYAEGMIFVPVGNGRIQALRADTLEGLWVSEAIEGQTLNPITYHNGYIYSATWNQETRDGTYYGISVTDEDPTRTDEIKLTSWKLSHFGGFYWAGSYATDNYVIFGSDDGSPLNIHTETAILYSVNPLTGEIIDKVTGIIGDIRSTVSYDKDSDRIYFSTKGGAFYQLKVNDDGSFDHGTLRSMELGGMSTGTPLIYNGRAYLGVAGSSQFSATGHSYKIIDINSMTEIYSADIPGYVQTSALLSSYYVHETGKVYIYTTYNYPPGGIYMLEDSAGQTEQNAQSIFVPTNTNYSISSLVSDSEGTIYYKNDSGYLMAVARSTGTEIITLPEPDENNEIRVIVDSSGKDILIPVADSSNPIKIEIPSASQTKTMLQLPKATELPLIEAVKGNITATIPQGVTVVSGYSSALEWITAKAADDPALKDKLNAAVPTGRKLGEILHAFTMGGLDRVEFSDFVALTFKGMRGKEAAYIQNGQLHLIDSFSSDTAGRASGKSEYAYNSGSDLIVKTKHFTDFVAFTTTVDTPGGGGPLPSSNKITLSIDKITINKGYVLSPTEVEFTPGESVWDVVKREMDNRGIHYSASWYGNYGSVYVSSIDGDGEFDHGSGSGWMYNVNGSYPNYGSSVYTLKAGDVVQWRYTTNLGIDLGEDPAEWEGNPGNEIIIPSNEENPIIHVPSNRKESYVISIKEKLSEAGKITINIPDESGKVWLDLEAVKDNIPYIEVISGTKTLIIEKGTEVDSKQSQIQLFTGLSDNQSLITKHINKSVTVIDAFEMGDPVSETLFSQPVTLKLQGAKERQVGIIDHNGNWYEVPIYASELKANEAIEASHANVYAYIAGNDLIVRSNHFSTFVIYTEDQSVPVSLDEVYTDAGQISSWALEYVQEATALKFVEGYNGALNPKQAITRAEFAKLMVEILGVGSEGVATSSFSDVTESDWFYPYVTEAYSKGVIKGYQNRFYPNDSITREEMAAMIGRALGLEHKPFSAAYSDHDSISSWAVNDVYTLAESEIMTGPGVQFDPKGLATREMAIVVAMRAYHYSK